MKISDTIHSFADARTHISRGICRARVFVAGEGKVVLFTDLGRKNDGQSVTNAIELIVSSFIKQGKVIGKATFIEHYEHDSPALDTFDVVSVGMGIETSWKKISHDDVLALIGGDAVELSARTAHNQDICAEADRLRFARKAFADSPYPESHETTKRRIEIVDGMIGKASVEALVAAGAGERELQQMLKSDLSVFGEAYAPDDEYICFSEFPLGDGLVDFVVLTGRSRMDVILIEVKGAEFNLVNSGHYAEFNHKINEAAGQIRGRLRHVFQDIGSFRAHVHAIRSRAEAGVRAFNAFLGPISKLEVDPQKDINIRTVIIGGRSVNDLEESRKRHDFERGQTPPVRVESWDTWLRHLRRI